MEEKTIKIRAKTNEILKTTENKVKQRSGSFKRSRIQRLYSRPRKRNLKRKEVFVFYKSNYN